MQIIHSVIWLPAPGRQADTVAAFAAAKKIHESYGAKVRGFSNLVAGTNSGRLAYTLRHNDWAAFAKFGQALQADAAWQALWASLQGANPVATMETNVLVNVIEETAGTLPSGTGARVRSFRGYAFDPARRDEAVALLSAQRKVLEGFGGHTTISQLQYGGPLVNRVSSSIEYADMSAFAGARDKMNTDASFQAAIAKLSAAGSPLTLMATSLITELPI